MWLFLLVALAVTTVSITVTQSVLFKPVREFLGWKVLQCSYCFSHWVSFVFSLVLATNFKEWIIYSFSLVCVVTIISYPILLILDFMDNRHE